MILLLLSLLISGIVAEPCEDFEARQDVKTDLASHELPYAPPRETRLTKSVDKGWQKVKEHTPSVLKNTTKAGVAWMGDRKVEERAKSYARKTLRVSQGVPKAWLKMWFSLWMEG